MYAQEFRGKAHKRSKQPTCTTSRPVVLTQEGILSIRTNRTPPSGAPVCASSRNTGARSKAEEWLPLLQLSTSQFQGSTAARLNCAGMCWHYALAWEQQCRLHATEVWQMLIGSVAMLSPAQALSSYTILCCILSCCRHQHLPNTSGTPSQTLLLCTIRSGQLHQAWLSMVQAPTPDTRKWHPRAAHL
jgi:hypothetical protein